MKTNSYSGLLQLCLKISLTFYGVWHIWEIFVVYLSRSQGGKLSQDVTRCDIICPASKWRTNHMHLLSSTQKCNKKTFMGFPPLQFDPQYDTSRPQLQQRSLSIFVWDQYFFLKVQHFLYKINEPNNTPWTKTNCRLYLFYWDISPEWRQTSIQIYIRCICWA